MRQITTFVNQTEIVVEKTAKTNNTTTLFGILSKNIFLFLIVLLPFIFYGQEETSQKTAETKNSSYITFGVSPLQFIVTPRWKFGYIQNINEKMKIGLNFGIGGNNFVFSNYNSSFKEYFIWEVRPEIYFIHNPGRRISMYNSFELFYIYEDDVVVDSRFITENDNTIYFDQADYNRQKFGAVVNFGVFIPFTSHFGMNVYAGMGIKWRNNKYSNIINPEFQIGHNDYIWRSYFRKEGLKIGFEPNFGLKLNYIL